MLWNSSQRWALFAISAALAHQVLPHYNPHGHGWFAKPRGIAAHHADGRYICGDAGLGFLKSHCVFVRFNRAVRCLMIAPGQLHKTLIHPDGIKGF